MPRLGKRGLTCPSAYTKGGGSTAGRLVAGSGWLLASNDGLSSPVVVLISSTSRSLPCGSALLASREDHPAIEAGGSLKAGHARPDPNRRCGPLDHLPEAHLRLGSEARNAN